MFLMVFAQKVQRYFLHKLLPFDVRLELLAGLIYRLAVLMLHSRQWQKYCHQRLFEACLLPLID